MKFPEVQVFYCTSAILAGVETESQLQLEGSILRLSLNCIYELEGVNCDLVSIASMKGNCD
jgi:hypothetical protein